MLEFTSLDSKEQSNEGIIEIIVPAIVFGVLYIWFTFSKINRWKEKAKKTRQEHYEADLVRYQEILSKHYPDVCKYIKTELKNDPFFFKEKRDLFNMDQALVCVTERISIVKKLMNLPEPTQDDTEESYKNTVYNFIEKNSIKIKNRDAWESYCETNGTYASNGWLDDNKVKTILKYTQICNELDAKLKYKLDKISSMKLKGKHGDIEVWEIFYTYLDTNIYSRGNTVDCWVSCSAFGLKEGFKDMAKHLLKYLKNRYGKEKINEIISKIKNK